MLKTPEGKLALIDFGSVADITEEERYGLFGLVIGLQNKDLPLITENLLKVSSSASYSRLLLLIQTCHLSHLFYVLLLTCTFAAWLFGGHNAARLTGPPSERSNAEVDGRNRQSFGRQLRTTPGGAGRDQPGKCVALFNATFLYYNYPKFDDPRGCGSQR